MNEHVYQHNPEYGLIQELSQVSYLLTRNL